MTCSNDFSERLNIAKKLEAARKATGMSMRRVAEKLSAHGHSLTHATIANYESGKTKPPIVLLTAIADLYGRPINWFLRASPTLVGIQYRALKSVRAAEKRTFEAKSQRWLEAYRNLEDFDELVQLV